MATFHPNAYVGSQKQHNKKKKDLREIVDSKGKKGFARGSASREPSSGLSLFTQMTAEGFFS